MYYTLRNEKGKKIFQIMGFGLGFGIYKDEKATLSSIEERGDLQKCHVSWTINSGRDLEESCRSGL